MAWTSKDPVSLAQARKILEIARSLKASDVNPRAMQDASVALAQAANSARGGSRSAVEDYSRRASSLASEAIRDTNKAAAAAKTAAEKAAREAKTAAEKAALEQKVAVTRQEGEATAAGLKAQIDQIAAERNALAMEKAALEKQRVDLEAERDALAKRLGGALDRVSSFSKTARGMMMSLGDISFDVGQATLKTSTQVALGKLAGVLLMLPDQNIRIEGFTDSTGSEETNRKLSAARAKAVRDFLEEQGVSAGRMTYGGYGPADPVASNDTASGRAKNRRVEITLGEGQIEATPAASRRPPRRPGSSPRGVAVGPSVGPRRRDGFRPGVMAVLNVTPDSFSDGGRFGPRPRQPARRRPVRRARASQSSTSEARARGPEAGAYGEGATGDFFE